MIEDPTPSPDLSGFSQPYGAFEGLTAGSLVALAGVVSGEIGHATPPDRVPWLVLEAMEWDPVIKVGEAARCAPVLAPDLYYVRHPDPAIKAELEEWLWPLMRKGLLPTIARAAAMGVAPYVCEWAFGDLVVMVQRDGAEKPRRSTARGFYSYSDVYDLAPGEVSIQPDAQTGRKVEAIKHGDRTYGSDRAYVAVYDRQYGRWIGSGSRRRAYKAWFREQFTSLWEARYLERSVDSPRVGYAPPGTIKIGGQDRPATEILNAMLMGLKGGGAGSLPSSFQDGNRLWDVKTLDLPDRSEVWSKALNRYDAQKLLACMVPPSTVGVDDATFAGARIPAQLFVDFVQQLAVFVANEITQGVVRTVHRVNYGDSIPPPEVLAYEIPQAKKKLLLDVFSRIADMERKVGKDKVVKLGELVDAEILDQLGLPVRAVSDAARERQAAPADVTTAPPGRPIERTSEREERREAAREPEGEDATGADGEQVQA